MHVADVELCRCKSLLGRLEIEGEGPGRIGGNPAPELVHHAEVKLGGREAAIGRQLVEAERLSEVLGPALPAGVGVGQGVKGLRIFLFRQFLESREIQLAVHIRDGRTKHEQSDCHHGVAREVSAGRTKDHVHFTHGIRLRTERHREARRRRSCRG